MTRTSAQAKRLDFIGEIWNILEAHDEDVYPDGLLDFEESAALLAALMDYVAENAPTLGRTARWQRACGWFNAAVTNRVPGDDGRTMEQRQRHLSWVFSQGMVSLGYAVE